MNYQEDENLIEAIKLYEEGKSIPEILDLFPNEKTELEAIFSAIAKINSESNEIKPNPDILRKIIGSLRREPEAKPFDFKAVFRVLGSLGAATIMILIFLYSKGFIPDKSGSEERFLQDFAQSPSSQELAPVPENKSAQDQDIDQILSDFRKEETDEISAIEELKDTSIFDSEDDLMNINF